MEKLQVSVYLEDGSNQEGRKEMPYMRYHKRDTGPSSIIQESVSGIDVQP